MKLNLLNIDKFVAANALQQVTNPIVLDHTYKPMPDGILSTDIFGATMKDRHNTFAYIDLNCHVLQPLIYKTLKRLDRRIDDILSGVKTFSIDKEGQLVEAENGNTGSEWLYKVWDKIKWKKNDSFERNQRVSLLESCSKDQIFQSKEIVIPAFYRDVNIHTNGSSKPAIEKINSPYTRLIRYAEMLRQGDFAFNLNYNRYQIQKTVLEIYDELKSRIEKKRGLLRQSLMGKSVDYGARVVISSAKFTANRPSDMLVDFYHAGVPVAFCVSCFTPFFVGWIQRFFQNEFSRSGMKYPFYNAKTKQMETIELVDPDIQFSEEKVDEMMKTFIKSPANRFDPVILKTKSKEHPEITMRFSGLASDLGDETPKDIENLTTSSQTDVNLLQQRAFTLLDLFYIASCDITSNKHVYITRYPIANYMSIFPIRISVLTTQDTCQMKVGNTLYKHYPIVDLSLPKQEIPGKFIEVVNMQNTYLQSIGGDYDGDQITVKGVFSQEANAEADKIMKSVVNITSPNSTATRTTTIEAVQTCYSVTRWADPKEEKFK